MDMEPGLAEAAQLFKVLGSESRLLLLRLLAAEPRTVGALTEATGMSQQRIGDHRSSVYGYCGLVLHKMNHVLRGRQLNTTRSESLQN